MLALRLTHWYQKVQSVMCDCAETLVEYEDGLAWTPNQHQVRRFILAIREKTKENLRWEHQIISKDVKSNTYYMTKRKIVRN